MIEFDYRDIADLLEVDGIVLQDVHGLQVEDFAEKLGYEGAVEMLKEWFSGNNLAESDLLDWCMESFDGTSAEAIAEDIEYNSAEEDYIAWKDHERDKIAGK